MHLITVVVLTSLGAIGAWFGFVRDFELAFLLAILAWGIVTVGIFRGNFQPPQEFRYHKSAEQPQPPILAISSILLFLLGGVAMWFGFVNDLEVGFLLGLIVWFVATLSAFSGNAPIKEHPRSEGPTSMDGGVVRRQAPTLFVIFGILVGALGTWYGLVHDIEWSFLIGMLAWFGATISTFKGKISE